MKEYKIGERFPLVIGEEKSTIEVVEGDCYDCCFCTEFGHCTLDILTLEMHCATSQRTDGKSICYIKVE